MSNYYSEVLEEVDAAVFSGEMLDSNITEFMEYIQRWQRAVKEHCAGRLEGKP